MPAALNTRVVYRSLLAFVLVTNFCIAAVAQTASDTRQAKIARANREVAEAAALEANGGIENTSAAINKLIPAVAVFAESGEKDLQMSALAMLGNFQLTINQRDNGTASLNKAIELARELNNPSMQIILLSQLGESYFANGETATTNKERAKAFIDEAILVIEKLEPKPEPISYDAYELLGRIWMSLYNPPNARYAFIKAFLLKKDKPAEESVPAILVFAKHMMDMGFPKMAIAPLEDARKKALAAKLPELEALATWAVGDLMAGKFRDLPNAKRYLQRTEQLVAANPDEALKAKLMMSWGKYYFATFDLQKSADYFAKAVDPKARTTPSGLKGEVFLNFGILNYTAGNFPAAIQLLTEAATLNEGASHKLMEVESLRYLARCQDAMGNLDEALNTMAKALTARGDSGQGYYSSESVAVMIDHADLFIELAQRAEGKMGTPDPRLTRAKGELEMALRNAQRERMQDLQSLASQRLAYVYSLLGDSVKATSLLNDALIVTRSAGLPVQEAGAMTGLMDLSIKIGNSGGAIFYGKSAVNVFQQLRKRIADLAPEIRASYLKTIEGTYRKLASLLIEQGRIAEAEQVLTLLKEEELMEYVRRDDSVAKGMLQTLSLTEDERSAITRYDVIADQITALGKEFDALDQERRKFAVGAFPKQQRYDEVNQQLKDASITFQKFLEGLKITFGQKDSSVAQVDSGLKRLLSDPKNEHVAIVSTIVGDDALNIIVTTRRTQRAHTVKIAVKDINELVGKFRAALTSPQYDPRPSGQTLYDLIVKPIEGDLAGIKADTILWSFDGVLRYLPPAAIWDKTNGYMAERFANVMINLASRDGLNIPRTAGQLSALGVGVSKPTDGFSALTAVPDELDCIVSDKTVGILSAKPQCANGVLSGRKLLDEKFTLANFEGELGRYPIVHIASHFKLMPGDNKNSFLLLGGGDDRKFTVEKLQGEQQMTDVDLIVLSACNTATPGGTKANGLEIEGFGSIAQKEGAKAVMATLWSVADTSTKDFMVEFYRLYGKEGLSKAVAMRKAQLKLMYGKYSPDEAQKHRSDDFVTASDKTLPKFTPDPNAPFAHPFYWSPFVLTGNWQ